MVMKIFYRIEFCSLIIRITRKSIDKCIYLSYFWYITCSKFSIICWRSYKKCTILKKISPHTIFTYCRISNISISDIHCILRPESVTDRECNLLVPYHKPRMFPKVVIIHNNYSWNNQENTISNKPKLHQEICKNRNR